MKNLNPKKPLAALIVSGAPKQGPAMAEPEVDEAEIAAQDILQAIDERDPAMLVAAFKALKEYC